MKKVLLGLLVIVTLVGMIGCKKDDVSSSTEITEECITKKEKEVSQTEINTYCTKLKMQMISRFKEVNDVQIEQDAFIPDCSTRGTIIDVYLIINEDQTKEETNELTTKIMNDSRYGIDAIQKDMKEKLGIDGTVTMEVHYDYK